MKRILFIVLSLVILIQAGYSAGKNYSVDIFVGKVLISHNKGKTWKQVSSELALKESDVIKTGPDSYCDIIMPNQGIFRVVDNTTIIIGKLDNKSSMLNLKKGKVVVKVTRKLDPDETFKVDTDIGVAAVRGTEFILDTDNKKLGLSVNDGTVNLKRNVDLPDDFVLDEELQKYLEVDTMANQTIEFTMDENKTLEKMIDRAKNNKDELLSVLQNSREATAKKLKFMKKNINRIFNELGNEQTGGDQDQTGQNNDSGDDDTSDVINKAKSKMKK